MPIAANVLCAKPAWDVETFDDQKLLALLMSWSPIKQSCRWIVTCWVFFDSARRDAEEGLSATAVATAILNSGHEHMCHVVIEHDV